MTHFEWTWANALVGGLLGGASVALSALVGAIGPGSLIAISGVGLVISVNEFVNSVETILYETGLTKCAGIRLMMATAGIVLSTLGIAQGVRAWQASGSLLEWAHTVQLPARTQRLISRDVGYNVSPERYFGPGGKPTLGEGRSFITDKEAIASVIGEFETGGIIKITSDQALRLEGALGLRPGTLVDGFRISRVTGIAEMFPSIPTSGNQHFYGPGAGLPGGGPELTIYPAISKYGGRNILQIIVQVIP